MKNNRFGLRRVFMSAREIGFTPFGFCIQVVIKSSPTATHCLAVFQTMVPMVCALIYGVCACFCVVSIWNQWIAKSKSNCPEMWPGLLRKVIKSLQVIWTGRTSKLLIELKASQFYFISLTWRFCNKTTQFSSQLVLEFVFVKSGLNTFTAHHTVTWFLEYHSKICQMWFVVLIVAQYNLLLK